MIWPETGITPRPLLVFIDQHTPDVQLQLPNRHTYTFQTALRKKRRGFLGRARQHPRHDSLAVKLAGRAVRGHSRESEASLSGSHMPLFLALESATIFNVFPLGIQANKKKGAPITGRSLEQAYWGPTRETNPDGAPHMACGNAPGLWSSGKASAGLARGQ